jgi:post-segregation antitoxin (ccd killing protein)
VAKVQTRRSISVSRDVHDTTLEQAEVLGISMSQLAELGLELLLAQPAEKIQRQQLERSLRQMKERVATKKNGGAA